MMLSARVSLLAAAMAVGGSLRLAGTCPNAHGSACPAHRPRCGKAGRGSGVPPQILQKSLWLSLPALPTLWLSVPGPSLYGGYYRPYYRSYGYGYGYPHYGNGYGYPYGYGYGYPYAYGAPVVSFGIGVPFWRLGLGRRLGHRHWGWRGGGHWRRW